MELKKVFRLYTARNQHMNATLSLQETKGSNSNTRYSTHIKICVKNVEICTVIIEHETKPLIKLHLCICDTLCLKTYYGATNIIIFLPTNTGYKLRGKKQVKEACIFCRGSSFIHKKYMQGMSSLQPLSCHP